MSFAIRQSPLRTLGSPRSVATRIAACSATACFTTAGPRFRATQPSYRGDLRQVLPQQCRSYSTDYNDKARQLSQKSMDEQEQQVKARQKQIQRPWLRDGADKPPVEDSQPLTQGKLLTTPTRLLKLVLPLPMGVEKDPNNNDKERSYHDYARALSANEEIQPLALLVHPQQPLSYLERLIQAELPPVIEDGKEKVPNIYFRAEDAGDSDLGEGSKKGESKTRSNVATYSGLGHEGPERKQSEKNWVRWSSSTEVGDFIRDAARGREFAIEVEGHSLSMRVAVPSFKDRTYYLRYRLRKMAREIDHLSSIKSECDQLAHRGAHRLAQGGFVLLTGWWGAVFYLTFMTDYGWDLVEPMTYLVGLTTIMGGYLYFLFISKDLSYKAAMNTAVSRRQGALYEAKGFDLAKWEHLVQEANALRREIRTIATEYDVEWDEVKDVGEDVKEVLNKERRKKGKEEEDEDEDEVQEKVVEEKDKGEGKDVGS